MKGCRNNLEDPETKQPKRLALSHNSTTKSPARRLIFAKSVELKLHLFAERIKLLCRNWKQEEEVKEVIITLKEFTPWLDPIFLPVGSGPTSSVSSNEDIEQPDRVTSKASTKRWAKRLQYRDKDFSGSPLPQHTSFVSISSSSIFIPPSSTNQMMKYVTSSSSWRWSWVPLLRKGRDPLENRKIVLSFDSSPTGRKGSRKRGSSRLDDPMHQKQH